MTAFNKSLAILLCTVLALLFLRSTALNAQDELMFASEPTAASEPNWGIDPSQISEPIWTCALNRPGLAYQVVPIECGSGPAEKNTWYRYAVGARSFYLNDLRLEFSGQEAVLGVEGSLRGEVGHQLGEWSMVLYGELFLNQRYDQNLLTDYELRESFSHNFETDTFEISQLSIISNYRDFSFEIGRFVTPFGRYYGPSFLNTFVDTPFIRSEAILFRETGALIRWEPSRIRLAAAITNGGPQKDTNSSKAFIGRLGMEFPNLAFGSSVKTQDGIGSEGQKEYNSHVGADFMLRLHDRIIATTELIYDEYGIRRPGLALDQIDWGRSIYNRQLNRGFNQPLNGWGYYANLIAQFDRVDAVLSFGEFRPDPIGNRIHDQTTRRFIGGVAFHLTPFSDVYSTILLENPVENAQGGRTRKGVFYNGGVQFRF